MPAPYPVHREATAAPVLFHPLPRATADRYRREAEAFDREAPRAKGHQSLLASALKVYKAILSFIDHATGRCDPGREAIAQRANLSLSCVDDALKLLRKLGMIDWTQRYRERDTGHGIERRQETNAYRFLPPEQWQGHRAGPRPATIIYGRPERVLTGREEAAAAVARRDPPATVVAALRLEPADRLAASLARLGAAIGARDGTILGMAGCH